MFNSDNKFDITHTPDRWTILWTTNISTASLSELICLLKEESIYHDHDHDQNKDFQQVYSYESNSATVIHEIITTDNQLRSILRFSRSTRNNKLILSLIPPSKSFSKWTFEEVCSEYGLSTRIHPSIMDIPELEGVEASPLNTPERINMKDQLLRTLKTKERAYKDPKENEAARSLFVEAYLSCAVALFEDDMQLRAEAEVASRRGYGPVGFSVHSRILYDAKEFTLGVTEIKQQNFEQGYAQNIIQLESTLTEVRKRKRIDLDIDDGNISAEDGRRQRRLRSYGIVTDSKEWYFVECTMHDDGHVSYKKAKISEEIYQSAEEKVEMIFRKIIWLCNQMRIEILDWEGRERLKLQKSSRKKTRFGGAESQVNDE